MKPERPNSCDVIRVGKMNEMIGELSLADPHAAWRILRESYLVEHAPAGQDRYKSILEAAINLYRKNRELEAIKNLTLI